MKEGGEKKKIAVYDQKSRRLIQFEITFVQWTVNVDKNGNFYNQKGKKNVMIKI